MLSLSLSLSLRHSLNRVAAARAVPAAGKQDLVFELGLVILFYSGGTYIE